jgi:DNA-binding transcriptional LysR family regulator
MDSNDLRIFIAVAQEGSVTRAAQRLGYVQSNITARIQYLESELNTQLFYRQQGMKITSSGEKLLPRAAQILHQLDEIKSGISDSGEPIGRLSIGANYTVSSLHLPKLLSQYHKAYPEIDLTLETSNSEDLIDKVLHFQLDGAFVKSQSLDDVNIVKELTSEEELVLIASPQYNNIQEVCANTFLMKLKGCSNRSQLEAWFKYENISPVRYIELNTLDSIIEGVIEGLGVSFVPQSSIREFEQKGRIKSFPIPSEFSSTTAYFIRHKNCVMTSGLTKFIEMIKNETAYRR